MKKIIFIIPLLILSCASHRDATRSDSDRENLLSEFEMSFNPSDYDEEIRLEEKKKESVEIKPKEKVNQEIINGFRIQIAMTKEINEANTIKNDLINLFPEQNVYVIFESPYYKIRLGDFTDKESANRMLPNIVDKGYKSAWVVPDKVVKK
ncbi:MAG: hypothetical protein IGBAC_0542 [Ignavibacteriae bacterium]|nr:MAG: hypothetical protein IGBAC_0542 [Ignavibacteriota bacterium]